MVLFIDARNGDERERNGKIDEALHMPCPMSADPQQVLKDNSSQLPDDKTTEIKVFCAVGGRAGRLVQALNENGYKNATNAGGYSDVVKTLS